MATERRVVFYQDTTGKEPFNDWLRSLRNARARRRILSRLLRVESGNYGDCRSLKDGVFELRFVFGPGYRVYFGEDGDTIVVLLCGGDKGIQVQDIARAKAYWKEYLNHV